MIGMETAQLGSNTGRKLQLELTKLETLRPERHHHARVPYTASTYTPPLRNARHQNLFIVNPCLPGTEP